MTPGAAGALLECSRHATRSPAPERHESEKQGSPSREAERNQQNGQINRKLTGPCLSVKNRLDEVKFRCFPVKRTLRRQECSPRRSGGERTVYLSCSTKRFPPSCCFASRRQRSNETDAGRPVQRKLLAAGPANHTGGSRNRHGGDWLPGRPQGEGFRNPESGFCDRCGDVLRV